MANGEYVLLDTKAFDNFIASKEQLLTRYDEINTTYDSIVNALSENWKGLGAEAFMADAKTVKTNIGGIYDILKTMCDTLTDCREVFGEADSSLGEYNRDPQ